MTQSHLFDVTYKKFHVIGNVCRHFFYFCFFYLFIFFNELIFFSFSSGCDRYVENGDECCNRTFLDHLLPTLWKMLPIVYSFVYRKRILTPQTRLFYSTWTKVPCHRLGNRWDKMSVCSDIHRFLYMYALIDRLKLKRETKLCRSSP